MRKGLQKVPQTLPVPHHPGQLTAASGAPITCSWNPTSKKEVRISPLNLATWNVCTLLDRDELDRPQRCTALIASELRRYNVDIAALSETRLAREGKLCEWGTGYTFFWSGHGPEERHEAGVGFAVKSMLVGKLAGPQKEWTITSWWWDSPFPMGRSLSPLSAPMHPPWPTQMRSRTSFMKTWMLSSPLFPALINSSFLVTLMWELAVTASPGKGWLGSMGLATATAMTYYSSRPVLNMAFWLLTPFSTFLPATGHHGCILALSIGISSIMSSSGRGKGRTYRSQELCLAPSAGQTTNSSSPSSTSASSPRDIHRAWKHPNAQMSRS